MLWKYGKILELLYDNRLDVYFCRFAEDLPKWYKLTGNLFFADSGQFKSILKNHLEVDFNAETVEI